MSDPGRAISCPYCSTGYFLPARLIGAAGARVRCPNCTRTFVVGAEGEAASAIEPRRTPPAASPPAAPAPPAPGAMEPPAVEPAPPPIETAANPAPAAEATPRDRAVWLLDQLAERHGEALEAAAAEGRLFSAYGREVMETFDAWRREAGRDADPAHFRAALAERWGVQLEPGTE